MNIHVFRFISVISLSFLLAAMAFAFFATALFGFVYLQFTTRLGSELSLLTTDFALAFLGNYADVFSAFPRRALWAWCLWLLLLFWPAAQVIWAIRAEDFEKSAGRVWAYLHICLSRAPWLLLLLA